MEKSCLLADVSRQAFYQHRKRLDRKAFRDAFLLAEVKAIRNRQPRIGARKLLVMLRKKYPDPRLAIGRDCFFKLLREHDLLIKRKKKYARTTNSMHRFKKYKNQIKDLMIARPNQVFVADITYLDTFEGFCYLALVTDVYSRKIVGYDVSRSLAIEGSLRALKMALKGVRELEKLIHHSDRGLQYCSHAYVDYLLERNITISMTEENHVYENAIAERVNGILKIEFMLGDKLISVELAKELVPEAIQIYNDERPHLKLGYKTPNKVYGKGEVIHNESRSKEELSTLIHSYPQKKEEKSSKKEKEERKTLYYY